ncbi:putative ankyrin repeat protein RF_0381 [Haliotis rubra]|uniref:putative ankyrin repeat protein RF_0381 n=1 Tax=Haliotis rubra TaxID=36100 RepID=UPI001EE5F85B|nr:putative ankyrin repeat protein RF_0381 [Haliotis rubra]
MTAAENGRRKVYDFLARKGCDLSVKDNMENTILHAASVSDNGTLVNCILSREIADTESRGENGETPVMVAAVNGQKKVFDLLVQKGCDLSVRDDYGNNILHAASVGGDVQIVEYLLSRDYLLSRNIIHIDSINDRGWTPVMLAAANGQQDVFDLLVKNECDLKVSTEDNINILHAASYGGSVQIVEGILSRKIADTGSCGENGATPVMVAAQNGQRKVFDLLVRKDCDLSVEDDSGSNILHYACVSDNVQIVESILSRKVADKDSRGEHGATPVMVAAQNGQRKVFDLLVRKDCDLSVEDDSGSNILHYACVSDNVQIVESILSLKVADKDSRGEHGATPVMVAAQNGQRKVFDLLVRKGCNLSVEDDSGSNILHYACVSGNVQIVESIHSLKVAYKDSRGINGATPVMVAAEIGRRKVFDLMVRKGCNLSVEDDSGSNILHYACVSGNVQIVESIHSLKVADKDSRGINGATPVMVAAENGRRKVFDLLVRKGCNLLVEDDSGSNILHYACVSGNVQIVESILSLKVADKDSRGKNGATPVMVAAQNGRRKVFDLLVRKGCNLLVEDDSGSNIHHYACVSGNVQFVDYIFSQGLDDQNSKDENGQTPMMVAESEGSEKVISLLESRGYGM